MVMHIIILYVVDTAFPAYQGHHNTWPYLPSQFIWFFTVCVQEYHSFCHKLWWPNGISDYESKGQMDFTVY